jgi:hypothetical protein
MCAVVIFVLGDRFIAPRLASSPAASARHEITGTVGDLAIDGARLTAIVVVSSTCKFCAQDAGFYRQIIGLKSELPRGVFGTVFVSPKGDEDTQVFMTAHGLPQSDVRTLPPELVPRVTRTPVLLLVDSDGRIAASWVGTLTQNDKAEVLASITGIAGNN